MFFFRFQCASTFRATEGDEIINSGSSHCYYELVLGGYLRVFTKIIHSSVSLEY